MSKQKFMHETRTIQTNHVLPPDTNHHGTLFGGQLMAYIDNVASIAATKLARQSVVTASTNSVDFFTTNPCGRCCYPRSIRYIHRP